MAKKRQVSFQQARGCLATNLWETAFKSGVDAAFCPALHMGPTEKVQIATCILAGGCYVVRPFMKADIHPKYADAEIRCACGNVIKTRSTKSTIIVGICNSCHPFYTGNDKVIDTAGRVERFKARAAKVGAKKTSSKKSAQKA